MFYLEGYGCICISNFFVKKTNNNKKNNKQQNPTKQPKPTKTIKASKQKPKARISCLLRMKVRHVGVYPDLLWDRECREGRVVRSSPRQWAVEGLGAGSASTSRGQQWPAGRSVPAPLSLQRRTQTAREFFAIWAWTRNLLVVLGKFTYKLSLCTCDTEWTCLKYRVLMCCGFKC